MQLIAGREERGGRVVMGGWVPTPLYAARRAPPLSPRRSRYPPAERAPQWVSTVAEQKRANIHLHEGVDEAAFVAMRSARDKTLAEPVLLLPAIQVNVRAGQWPAPEANGVRYLKIPLNAL
jgi:hypothetical protein